MNQLEQYGPVGLLLIATIGMAAGMIVVSMLLGQKGRPNPVKDSAYECGKPEITDPHARFSVRFYLVAMLFILFDIEVVFLYPWAAVYKDLLRENASLILGSMISFLVILFVGYVYALKKRAFDWKN